MRLPLIDLFSGFGRWTDGPLAEPTARLAAVMPPAPSAFDTSALRLVGIEDRAREAGL